MIISIFHSYVICGIRWWNLYNFAKKNHIKLKNDLTLKIKTSQIINCLKKLVSYRPGNMCFIEIINWPDRTYKCEILYWLKASVKGGIEHPTELRKIFFWVSIFTLPQTESKMKEWISNELNRFLAHSCKPDSQHIFEN